MRTERRRLGKKLGFALMGMLLMPLSSSGVPRAPVQKGAPPVFPGGGPSPNDRGPDLETVRSPALSRALQTPENLWKFLTDADTPYEERMAAAVQGKKLFPLSWVKRLVTAQSALEDEQNLHHWGLKMPPFYASGGGPRMPLPPAQRKRLILGQIWIAPDKLTDFEPSTWKQKEVAPWPWQVESALDELFKQIAPSMHVNNPPADVAYAERWYAEAMKMPSTTDRQALLFVKVTTFPMHYKSLPILAAWRRIALDPNCPLAAERIASDIGEAMYLWGDPSAQDIGQALTVDIVNNSADPKARSNAAWYARHLKTRFTANGPITLPSPMQVVVALGDAALQEKTGSKWDRLYSYVEPACALLSDPPIKADIAHMPPDSPEAEAALNAFCAWFQQHRAMFVEEGEKQIKYQDDIDTVRGLK